MTDTQVIVEEVKGAGRFLGHTIALLLGLLLLVGALAMGVSIVLLPASLAVGAAGFLLIVSGLYTKPQMKRGR